MKRTSSLPVLLLLICGLCTVFVVSGCGGPPPGPDLGTVTGTVTLDGKPLADASITFTPANGRPSVGTTDASGKYTLSYTIQKPGAMLGKHKVTITTQKPASGGEGDEPAVRGREELLPAKYHAESELTADVQAGPNTIDFALESK